MIFVLYIVYLIYSINYIISKLQDDYLIISVYTKRMYQGFSTCTTRLPKASSAIIKRIVRGRKRKYIFNILLKLLYFILRTHEVYYFSGGSSTPKLDWLSFYH